MAVVGLTVLPMIAVPGSVEHGGDDAPGSPRPNIVLVLTDDQRWDTLWAMPTVRAELVGKGITFTNGFVVNPICCSSRASILTGSYSHSTDVYRDRPPHGGFSTFTRRGEDRSTVATWLQAAGYRTALVGKYLNGYGPQQAAYVPPGWDRWAAFVSRNGNGDYFDYALSIDGDRRGYGSEEAEYSTDALAGLADSFIRTTSPEEPLFLYFAPIAPHRPATPAPRHGASFSDLEAYRPPSFNEADVSDKPGYVRSLAPLDATQQAEVDAFRIDQYRTLLAADDAVRTILTALQDTGRLEDTLFVFTSDNGLLWGEHRWVHKLVPYEESIRVPMVVRYDAMISAPRVDDHLVANIDLAPTFAASSGAEAPEAEGRSLLPLLASSEASWRSRFLIEHLRSSTIRAPTYCALRTPRYAYVAYGTGAEELYDLDVDAFELHNVAADPAYATILAAKRARLRTLCRPAPPGYSFTWGRPPAGVEI